MMLNTDPDAPPCGLEVVCEVAGQTRIQCSCGFQVTGKPYTARARFYEHFPDSPAIPFAKPRKPTPQEVQWVHKSFAETRLESSRHKRLEQLRRLDAAISRCRQCGSWTWLGACRTCLDHKNRKNSHA